MESPSGEVSQAEPIMLCASLVLTRVIILLAATGTGCE